MGNTEKYLCAKRKTAMTTATKTDPGEATSRKKSAVLHTLRADGFTKANTNRYAHIR